MFQNKIPLDKASLNRKSNQSEKDNVAHNLSVRFENVSSDEMLRKNDSPSKSERVIRRN